MNISTKYLTNKRVIVTSAPGSGSTSYSLYLSDNLVNDNFLIYYDLSGSIDREFVKKHYNNFYNKGIFVTGNLKNLFKLIVEVEEVLDVLIVDSADIMMVDKNAINNLLQLSKVRKFTLLCTSQIRQDPTKNIYSTIERLDYNFDYSIWIRNVTEKEGLLVSKYIDVFDEKRIGNKYIERFICYFSKTGAVIE